MGDDHYPRIDIKRLSWEEYALICVVAVSVIIYGIHISQFKQLPSPIFGGDIYRDRGFVKNIVAGNPVWSDGFYANEIQYYPYLVFALQALFVKITGVSVDGVVLYFPLITLILSAIAWYVLGLRIFKIKRWALLTSLSFIGFVHWYFPKSAGVAVFLTIPLFLYFWLKYEQENKLIDSVFAGLFLGLTSLIWGGIFVGIIMTSGVVIVYFFIKELVNNHKHKNSINLWKTIYSYIKKYYPLFIVAILISLIFFLPLLIKYQMKEYNLVTKWGDEKIGLLGPSWILSSFKGLFFDTSSIITIIFTLISLIGILSMLFSKKRFENIFVLALFIGNIIILQHHLITRPLLHWSFLPQKMAYLYFFIPIFFVFGILTISSFMKKENIKKLVFIAALIIIVISFSHKYSVMSNDQWDKAGRSDPAYVKSLYALGDFLEKNMAKDETVLSNDESGFMLAIVSGRKVMLTRRTHASYYVDIDKRIAEATVAMYGNNVDLTKEILDRYNVKYLYLDQNIFQNYMRVRPDLKQFLVENKIAFVEAYDRYDIAVPPERANMQDLLLIPPQNLSEEFTSLWIPVHNVVVQGQTVGQLFRLKES
ncbi:TPA: hypothetical protein HA235_06795 [Candidatus Woesearchaeota archaeon]|nr:hypothetical protein [uncultured archaeon]MBS3172845.1 hypothetical protein [Candidatus Woesearchaeota archaeon]HIH32385.1 hypothetical protein [Candidatus Woesearchaeota archaeon]HIH54516.1 hypothetical protein [Candidatus Woesearchaeota archaeon]HIJ02262.1 hypothetical protein [Candidatus Woesearchaeota archaeon]